MAAEKPDLDVHMPPGAPRLACCGGVMNVRKDEAVGWRRQRYPHGSPDWVDSYNRRATSERHNAAEKNTQRLGAMDILVLGLAKRALIAVFAAMATNLRLVASHEARVAAGKLKAKR